MKNNKLSKRLELDGDPLTNEKIFRRNFTTIFIFLPLFPLFLGISSTFYFIILLKNGGGGRVNLKRRIGTVLRNGPILLKP